jgi:hypothetical protein
MTARPDIQSGFRAKTQRKDSGRISDREGISGEKTAGQNASNQLLLTYLIMLIMQIPEDR